MNKKSNSRKFQALLRLVLLVGVIVFSNLISSFWFTRFDLTSDKRFTLSEASKKLVGNLKDIVYVKVYLQGDFSPAFSRLSNSTRELLDELRTYSKGNLEYEFIDPSAAPNEEDRKKLYAQLYQKGIQPTTIEERDNEGMTRKYIFPGAVINFSNEEIGVQLLKNQLGTPPEMMLNNSIQNLEYEICNGIKKVTNPLKPKVAFLSGHAELNDTALFDITTTLRSSYQVERVTINETLNSLKGFKAVVIAKPDSAFSEKDKFIIDQYIMDGGKVLWMIDPIQAYMDSMNGKGETIGLARDLKIEDMLFRYGVRLNYDLVQDLVSGVIPVVTGYVGNQPKTELMPWYYFPIMTPYATHPIVRNLNSIKSEFVSTIDTISVEGVRKTVLLSTSKYCRVQPAPVRISLGIMQFKPNPNMFPNSNLTTAVLLEGKFTSVFKNRIPPEIANNKDIGFAESGKATQMVVVSDGDIIKNEIQKGNPVALGYDKYTKTVYGNKAFVENIVDYFCDESGLMAVRNKEYKLRLLDPTIIEKKKSQIQLLNTGLPVLLILLLGFVKHFARKRKFIS
jgi:ABC-2 type transport system permease protein